MYRKVTGATRQFSDAAIASSSSLSATIFPGTSARALLKSSQSLSPVVSDLKRTVHPLNRTEEGEGGRSALYINSRDKWREVVLYGGEGASARSRCSAAYIYTAAMCVCVCVNGPRW